MTDIIENFLKKIRRFELDWCNMMNFKNPYTDPFEYFISKNLPDFDGQAFNKYKKHNFVYDKLWVAQSQGLMCGKLRDLKKNENIKLPIFIKPRWGHETATSKNCFKIKNWNEIEKYKSIPDMMWSEFIDANEQMTDFLIVKGVIVFQITYYYSDTQNEFIDDWKLISSNNKPNYKMIEWVNTHLNNFTGPVNVQYRSDKIIEVGLRLARGGAYILSTKNKYLIQNINNVVDNNYWDHSLTEKCFFESFYSFKCYLNMPLLYIFPQYYMDSIMKKFNCMPFYEYYFEPAGKMGSVFFQFLNKDFEKGMMAKKYLENILLLAQFMIYFLFFCSLIVLNYNKKMGLIFLVLVGLLFQTRFLNPISVCLQQYKAFKQMIYNF